jgi:mono/diheme cytochrome c family protein
LRRHVLAAAPALVAAALLAAGCGTGGISKGKADTANGKQLFQERCGSCHTLADAGTQGKIGPNLDDAFAGPRREGFKESSIRNIVHGQIKYSIEHPAGFVRGPGGKEVPAPGMPQNLVTGDDAEDVAAYVASVAGVSAAGGTSTAATTNPSPAPSPPPATTTKETTTTEAPTTGGGASNLAAQGKSVFEKAGCTSCHTLKDAGATGTVGPNLDQARPSKDKVVERVTEGAGVMPSFKGQLSDQEIEAVATYVSSVAGT